MNIPLTCLVAAPMILGIFGSDDDKSNDIREVSVRYLNVAIGSLENESSLTLQALYGGDLSKTPLWQGHSQFSLVDPETGQSFSFAVCETGDPVFDTLLDMAPGTLLQVDGIKYKMSGQFYDCVVVTAVTILGPPPAAPSPAAPSALRLTITHEDGTREVIRNLKPGDSIEVDGKTLQLETE